MKKLAIVLFATFALVSCDGPLNVTLHLDRDLSLVTSDKSTHLLKAGDQDLSLRLDYKHKYVVFTVEENGSIIPGLPSEDSRYVDIRFQFQDESQIPKDNGPIELPSTMSGQPVDLVGNISTKVDRSELIHGYERCSVQVREERCYPVTDPNGRTHTQCEWVWVTEFGEREVEYHNVTTTFHLFVDLLQPASTSKIGNIDKTQVSTVRDYTYEGRCMLYGRRF